MKALELNTEDPAFQDGWAVTVIEQATIARLKMFRPKQAAQAVKQFTDIANLFNSISSALETVEIEWIKMNAEPEPYSFLSGWLASTSSSKTTRTNKPMTESGTLPESGPCRAIRSEKGFGLLRPLFCAAIAIATIANRTNRTTANREYELAVILR